MNTMQTSGVYICVRVAVQSSGGDAAWTNTGAIRSRIGVHKTG